MAGIDACLTLTRGRFLACYFRPGLEGKEMLSPFFLLQNSVADWGNSMPDACSWRWMFGCNLLRVLYYIPVPKKMHLIKLIYV
jgi:hypothetical protein